MENEKLISLVQAVQQGNEQAFTDLYNAIQPSLYYYISKTLNDPALTEDVLQNTILEIWQTIDRLEEPAAFVAWSRKIAYHRCTAHFRKTQDLLIEPNEDGHSILDDIEEDRTEFIPDEALDKEELKKTILAMINELPAEQRSAILLRFFDDLSVKEIAEIQGVSEGTVKSRLNYGKKAIKKSVENYEKKNGIKLRCAGVIPLLLWLFANEASAASAAASTASLAASAAAPVVAEGVKEGLKAAGKFAAKKIIAGITAAAVAAGGITAGVILSRPEDTTAKNTCLVGYGDAFYSSGSRRRFEMDIYEMDEDGIVGNLEVSYLYNTVYESDFGGSGTETDGKIVYEFSFETDTVEIQSYEYTVPEITAVYDKETQTLTMDNYFLAELKPVQETPIIIENAKWSGHGVDTVLGMLSPDHRLDVSIQKMTETEVQGELEIFYNNKSDHLTVISGRGFTKQDGTAWYEVHFHTPRTPDNVLIDHLKDFWLYYDPATESFTIVDLWFYPVELQKIFS